MLLLWIGCQSPPPPPPPVVVEVITTQGFDPASLGGARKTWRLATHGNVRSDLASLLTGLPYTEHGVSDPVSHTLAIALPPTRRREGAGLADGGSDPIGADEDWGFTSDAPVAWAHEAPPGDAAVHVVVGLDAATVAWIGEPAPAWDVDEVDAAMVGRAIRAVAEGRPIDPPGALGPIASPLGGTRPAPVIERVLPERERRRWTRFDTDVFGTSAPALDALERTAKALDARQLREAEERLAILPRSPATTGLQAELYWLQGRPLAAVHLYEQAFELEPSGTLALTIARRLDELRQPEAVGWYERTLAFAPGQPDAELALWIRDRDPARLARMDTPTFDRAMQLASIEQGIAVDTDDRLLAARSSWVQGRTTDALEEALALVAQRPRSIERRLLAARWALELEEIDRAHRLLAPVRRWLPDDPEVVALVRAARAAEAEDRRAVEALRRRWRWRR